ncbi:hypothetical protein ACHAWU_006719 [Discostella pseudostelligera]|uniref:SCP domain-containing protein n=1 Tax=Discostella pseudostelligera TaxID=259834 RepID=A0ABD3MCT8_9STRA
MLSRGNLLPAFFWVSLLLLHQHRHHHRHGRGVFASAESGMLLRGGGRSYGSGGSDERSSSGGGVKIRTTNSYRMFQLRATSMIRNRDIENNGFGNSTSPSEEGVQLVDDDNSTTNNAPLTQHSTSTIISTESLLPTCPPPYDPSRVDYFAGATAEVYNTIFRCRPSPYEKFCSIETLEEAERAMINENNDGSSGSSGGGGSNEDVKTLWLEAWKEVGPCSPPTESSIPTTSTTTISASKPTTHPNINQPPIAQNNTPSTSMLSSSSSSKPSTMKSTTDPTYHPTYSPTTSMMPTNYPTLAPSRSPLAMSPSAYDIMDEEDEVLICKSTQIHLRLEISTDNYPQDTSWQFIDRTANVILLSSPINGYSGTAIGNGMMEVQTDNRDICLNGTTTTEIARREATTRRNKYEFVMKDKYGDGMCCRPGVEEGYYKLMQKKRDILDNRWKWSVLVAGSNFRSKEVHHHFDLLHDVGTIESDIVPASFGHDGEEQNITKPIAAATSFELICPPPQRKITIQIQTDIFGADTSWDFRIKNGPILAKNEAKYHENHIEVDERDICVHDSSLYELTVYDDFGDGMCCAYKRGHYKILTHHPMSPTGLPTETILYGGFFISNKITHLINTTLPELSERSLDWLNSHNKRRLYWHTYYNASYIPLQWSDALQADAKVWADTLLDSCTVGMYHDPQKIYGENAAGNSGSGDWGTKRSADMIVARFIDREVDDPWPANSHLTQALWRASSYVGCADSHRSLGGGRQCHTQVCRYARIGNCDMGSHLNEDGSIDWQTPMLEDVNYCGPICPADGCKA